MAIKVTIDRNVCIGSGNCAFWLPEVFGFDDADVGTVLDPLAAPLDKVIEIARACPTQAITVVAED